MYSTNNHPLKRGRARGEPRWNLYRNESSDPKRNAQRNLMGRTHYVDDDTLRFHKSRVISARHTDNGLLFAIVTSDALDMNGSKRGFRFAIFDVFGTMVQRPDLEHAARTSEQATKWMWAALNNLDAIKITREAIVRQRAEFETELRNLHVAVTKIESARQGSAA